MDLRRIAKLDVVGYEGEGDGEAMRLLLMHNRMVDVSVIPSVINGGPYSSIKNTEETDIRTLSPLVGLVGSAAFFVMLLYFLFTRLPHVVILVVLAVVIFTVETAYLKRVSIREGIREVEGEVGRSLRARTSF